jgi:hypothetical protein
MSDKFITAKHAYTNFLREEDTAIHFASKAYVKHNFMSHDDAQKYFVSNVKKNFLSHDDAKNTLYQKIMYKIIF